jgi:hypothetical protein
MTTLTLELPDTVAQQLQQKQVDEREIKAVALAAVELWLEHLGQGDANETRPGGRFEESAVPFIRRLILRNKELFETLARR